MRHGFGGGSRGVSVLEAVVGLLLGAALMGLTLALLAGQRQVVAELGRRAEVLATTRTVRAVLRRELRAGGGMGWRSFQDSVSVRAFRGTGTPCPGMGGATTIRLTTWGVRAPVPAKDSVLVVTTDGRIFFRALAAIEEGWEAEACGARGASGAVRWTLSEPIPSDPVLIRYFEHGSYHLATRAFRYRRGGAGRQPLTPETLLTPESRFVRTGSTVRALLFFPGSGVELSLGVGPG